MQEPYFVLCRYSGPFGLGRLQNVYGVYQLFFVCVFLVVSKKQIS